jgi:hypothetical protein
VPGRGPGAAGRPVGASLLLAHAARTGALRPGLILISDKGRGGLREPSHLRLGAAPGPPRPPRRGTPATPIGWIGQWIEPVNDTLRGQLDLERHGGRTAAGVYTRITERLLAMATAFWHNWATGAQVKRSLISYDN